MKNGNEFKNTLPSESESSSHSNIDFALETIMSHTDMLSKEEIEDVKDIIDMAKKGAGPGPFGDTASYNNVVTGGGLEYLHRILLKIGKTPEETREIINNMLEDLNSPY